MANEEVTVEYSMELMLSRLVWANAEVTLLHHSIMTFSTDLPPAPQHTHAAEHGPECWVPAVRSRAAIRGATLAVLGPWRLG